VGHCFLSDKPNGCEWWACAAAISISVNSSAFGAWIHIRQIAAIGRNEPAKVIASPGWNQQV
jgi:hypothetical protein